MNSSPHFVHRHPRSTNVYPSMSETMSSTATSSPTSHTGQIRRRSPFCAGNDMGFLRFRIIVEDHLLPTLLPHEQLPLRPAHAGRAVRIPHRVPKVVLVPAPFQHPCVPEVFAHDDGDRVRVEGERFTAFCDASHPT